MSLGGRCSRLGDDFWADSSVTSQDLFLLHDPCGGPEKRLSAWKTLQDKQKEGKLKAIGVSNFVRLLNALRPQRSLTDLDPRLE